MNDLAKIEDEQNPVAMDVNTAREVQSVQAAVIMAKKFPRDIGAALKRIEDNCASVRLAEQAMYSYPRGGQTVTGPSIRMAEMIAQNWGNLEFGYKEIERHNGQSNVIAFAWDMETNTRRGVEFKVMHIRETKKGDVTLYSERDIYELIANQASRRVRACVLALVPMHIIEAAIESCEKTLLKSGTIEQKKNKIVKAFGDVDVTVDDIERRIGKKLNALSDVDYVQLQKIWKSMNDGMSKKSDWFESVSDPKKLKQVLDDVAQLPPNPSPEAEVERRSAKREFLELAELVSKNNGDVSQITGIGGAMDLDNADLKTIDNAIAKMQLFIDKK